MNEPRLTREIDKLCDAFEEALQAGRETRIEDFLQDVRVEDRENALHWLLRVELACRKSDGGSIDTETYLRRFPNESDTVTACLREMTHENHVQPVIPGYRLLELVSRGGQGAVYRAIQIRTGQEVAVKYIVINQDGSRVSDIAEQAIRNFETEVRTVATLRHPNVVRLYDAGKCEGGAFLVMEYLGGGTLTNTRQSINQYKAASLVKRIAEAIAEAHRANILHLDIKPQNILIDGDQDEPRLVDFGLAKLEAIGKRAEAIAGTPGYMAPEQVASGQLDERTDVYGLGATLYRLLTGRAPIEGDSVTQKIRQSASPEILRPKSLRPEIDERLEKICVRCLRTSPDDRYQTALELASELKQLEAREGGRNTVHMANGFIAVGIVFFSINLLVAAMLALRIPIPIIWSTMFLIYLPLFYVFHAYPAADEKLLGLTQETLWSIWLGKFVAEVFTLMALTFVLDDSYLALGLSYLVFMAFSGLAVCCGGAHFWKGLYVMAVLMWLVIPVSALLVRGNLWLGPLIYSTHGFGMIIYAFRLKQVSRRISARVEQRELARTALVDRE